MNIASATRWKLLSNALPAAGVASVVGACALHPSRAADIAREFLWGAAIVGGGLIALIAVIVVVSFIVNRFRPVEIGAVEGAEPEGRAGVGLLLAFLVIVIVLAATYAADGPEAMAYYAGWVPGIWIGTSLLTQIGRRSPWLVKRPKTRLPSR